MAQQLCETQNSQTQLSLALTAANDKIRELHASSDKKAIALRAANSQIELLQASVAQWQGVVDSQVAMIADLQAEATELSLALDEAQRTTSGHLVTENPRQEKLSNASSYVALLRGTELFGGVKSDHDVAQVAKSAVLLIVKAGQAVLAEGDESTRTVLLEGIV